MINRAMSGSKATLHISEQIVGFEILEKSTVDYSSHGFTEVTWKRNRMIIYRIRGIRTKL